jgi:adenosylcobinamide kinase/adenosylcobinamide-phosphate guanylyltransferase
VAPLLAAYQANKANWVVISNEVGLGIVPDNQLARRYRDALGVVNQLVAGAADRVTLMVAGIAVEIKGETS